MYLTLMTLQIGTMVHIMVTYKTVAHTKRLSLIFIQSKKMMMMMDDDDNLLMTRAQHGHNDI